MVELRHLRYFTAVAEWRNFTRAAEQLGVSQPPLSRQIRELEEELGVVLFLRDSRPVQLTEAGRLFHQQARRILDAVDQLAVTMQRWGVHQRPRFVIGVVGSILCGAVPGMIRAFRAASPGVEVELLEMVTVEQVAALKTGQIDAGLGRVPIDDPDVRRELLYEEPLLAALPADSPLAGSRDPLRLSACSGHALITYPAQPRPSYADQVLALLASHGVVPSHVREVRDVQTALGMVAVGEVLAIVPASMREARTAGIRYRAIADAGAVSPVILSQRRTDESALAAAIREAARAAFARPVSARGGSARRA